MNSKFSEDRIERELQKLVGLRAWGPGLAAGMLTVSFGNRYPDTTRSGKEREVGDYALHIQCAWRLVRGSAVVIGFTDYLAAEGQEGANEVWDRLKQEFSTSPIVKKLSHARAGAFSFTLESDLHLEAFPSLSATNVDEESWRIFTPKSLVSHFVVTPSGIED